MFKEYNHDFGKVALGDVPEHRFELQNLYKENIRIQSVTSSCGCTVASLSKNILKTWEKGEVICKFNSPAVGTGFKQATITVRFTGQFSGEVQLTVSGNIVGGVNFSTESIDFGQVIEGKMPAKTIKLSSNVSPMFQIVDVKSTFPHIKVKQSETARRGNYVSYDLTAQLADTAPKGFVQGELFVVYQENSNQRDSNGNPILKQQTLPFSAKVGSPVRISPGILSLGKLEAGETISKKVFITADAPFTITDVRCRSSAFSVKADPSEKKTHIIEVTYTGVPETGKHECDLNFYTSLNTDPSGVMKALVEIVDPIADDPVAAVKSAASDSSAIK
ncbi:MAG: DUF1573 domain-containing protein [Planctomycetota bacterium]